MLLIRDQRSLVKRNEIVIGTRHHHFRAEFGLDQLLEPLCYIENQFFFRVSVLANRACIMPAVTGVNDYSGELEAKTSY